MAGTNTREITSANIKARLLTGTYNLQAKKMYTTERNATYAHCVDVNQKTEFTSL